MKRHLFGRIGSSSQYFRSDSNQKTYRTPAIMQDDIPETDCFTAADEAHIKREKAKAGKLRQSQWWKNRKGEGQCYYCKQAVHPKELTMDHVVPLARGGVTRKSNVVPCCKSCNDKKKYLLPVEWAEYITGLRKKSGDCG